MAEIGLFETYQFPGSSDRTAAYADLWIDSMDMVLVSVCSWLPVGYGHDAYAWQRTTWLRYEPVARNIQWVVGIEGEYSVEGEWRPDEESIVDLLEAARAGVGSDALRTLASLMPEMAIASLSDDLLASLRIETAPASLLEAVVSVKPRWT